MDGSLLFRPAGELQPLIDRRELSALELVETMLAAIDRLQPVINAFVTVCADEARERAKAVDAALSRGESVGPLQGMPFVVKDLTWTAGVRTTMGSVTNADFVPQVDAVAVSRLKAAGAILIGKTTTPEFGHKAMTDSPLFGVTRNPWDLSRSPAGSSGGSAAAIAAGLGPLGLGTDGGGSIRIPASACGVVGLKPTLGRVPHVQAADGFNNLSHTGPMTRTVGDSRRVFEVIAGAHPHDLFSVGGPGDRSGSPAARFGPGDDLRGLRVAWLPFVGNEAIEPEVLSACEGVVRTLERMGAHVEPAAIDFVSLEEVFLVVMRAALAARLAPYVRRFGDRLSDTLRRTVELGQALTVPEVQRAYEERTRAFREVQDMFQRFDLLVSPVMTTPALPLSQGVFDPVTVAGETYPSLRSAWNPYTYAFNLTGHPALSLPAGFTTAGLPVGVQLAGPWYSEELLLDVAEGLERAHPWHDRRPVLA